MLYLELLHGRDDKNQDMESLFQAQGGRGYKGPVFLVESAKFVYHSNIQLELGNGKSGLWLYQDDLSYYDGTWYGEIAIYSEDTIPEDSLGWVLRGEESKTIPKAEEVKA